MKKEFNLQYEEYADFTRLSNSEKIMLQKTKNSIDSAYAPYSNFKVGATLLLSNGEYISATNQENIAYPSGMCAERVALYFAGSNYYEQSIESILLFSEGDLVQSDIIVSPCGACRQVMLESEKRQNKPIRIILVGKDDRVIVISSVKDLLPFAFGV